jgi:hypothetical protein
MLFHVLRPERLLNEGHKVFQLVKAVKAHLNITVTPSANPGNIFTQAFGVDDF